MNITIAGVGAMGSRFALMLHRAGHKVTLIDGWEEHVTAIQKNGLQANLNGEEVVAKLPIYFQSEVDPTLSNDLIILFTKAMQLEAMLADIQPLIHDNTAVLCLLNGIGHEEVIEKYVPRNQIMIGNTMWTAGMEEPGRAKLFGNGSIALKNLVADPKAEQAAYKVIETLNSAGLNAQYTENILYAIYKKACVNGTMNSLCTLLLANMADFGDTTPAHAIVEKIVSEFAAVAKYENVDLNVTETVDYIEKNCYNRNTIGLHYPSMYQDLNEHNRLTEIDYINGAVARKGQLYGVDTPYCALITELVHCKEQLLGAK